MRKYEGIVILKGNLPEDKLEEEYAKIEEAVKKHNGKIEKTEKWGRKKLSFQIEKFSDGFFLYLVFESMPESIKPLLENIKLNNNLLRVQITHAEK